MSQAPSGDPRWLRCKRSEPRTHTTGGRAARSASDERPSRPSKPNAKRRPTVVEVRAPASLETTPPVVEQRGAPATNARRDPVSQAPSGDPRWLRCERSEPRNHTTGGRAARSASDERPSRPREPNAELTPRWLRCERQRASKPHRRCRAGVGPRASSPGLGVKDRLRRPLRGGFAVLDSEPLPGCSGGARAAAASPRRPQTARALPIGHQRRQFELGPCLSTLSRSQRRDQLPTLSVGCRTTSHTSPMSKGAALCAGGAGEARVAPCAVKPVERGSGSRTPEGRREAGEAP